MPKDLPHDLKVDISLLTNLDSRIVAKDIALPLGVDLISKPEEVLASIAQAVEEKEEEAPVDLTAIEVEKKGKEVKEGEAPAATDAKTKDSKPKDGPAK